jgi:hypothetical protein
MYIELSFSYKPKVSMCYTIMKGEQSAKSAT